MACASMALVLVDRGDRTREAAAPVVDERAGTGGDVRLGASRCEVRRALGPGREGSTEVFSRDRGFLPSVYPPRGYEPPPVALRYGNRSFDFGPEGVHAMYVWAAGGRTSSGVRIGDDMSEVPARYPRTQGLEAGEDEVPPCIVRVGRRFLAFGEDPIRSITLASSPLGLRGQSRTTGGRSRTRRWAMRAAAIRSAERPDTWTS